MLRFIDISNWQAGIDVVKVVRNGGLGAVICKATEGLGFVDKQCDAFVQRLIDAGVPFGFYHFARNNDPEQEAEFFREHTKGYEGLGIPVLDWEAGQSVSWVNRFVRRYHELTGVWPWIYANAWRFNQGKVEENCGRWVAGYPANGITDITYGETHDMPYDVNDGLVCAWQFSSSVRISGYGGSLDGNVYYGDAASLGKYANPGGGAVSKPETSGPKESWSTAYGDPTIFGTRMASALESAVGTTVDGHISGQPASNKKYFWAVESSGVRYGSGGSDAMRALQSFLKRKGYDPKGIDGYYGKGAITAHQRWLKKLGYYAGEVDGYHGHETNKAMCRALYDRAYK